MPVPAREGYAVCALRRGHTACLHAGARVCRYVVPRPRTPGVAPVEMEGGLGWDEVGTAWQRVELEAPRVASVTPRAASRSSLVDSPDTDPASTASDDSRKRLAGQGGAGDDGPAVPKRARL